MAESYKETVSDLPPQDKRPYCFCDNKTYDIIDDVCKKCGFNLFCSGELKQEYYKQTGKTMTKRNKST